MAKFHYKNTTSVQFYRKVGVSAHKNKSTRHTITCVNRDLEDWKKLDISLMASWQNENPSLMACVQWTSEKMEGIKQVTV